MLDTDTFLTQLYSTVDDFCQSNLAPEPRLGHPPSLCRSEVVTLASFSQWFQFGSECGFYRFAERHLRRAFPRLPDRAQFNRLVRQHRKSIIAFFLHLAPLLQQEGCSYVAMDTRAVPTRDSRRRGVGWLPEFADIGNSSRLRWFEGLRLLLSVTPQGVITGYGCGSGSSKDQPLAATFLAARALGHPELEMVGAKAQGAYLTDKGFEGKECHERWRADYDAEVSTPPKRQNSRQWPKEAHRQLASMPQIIETVFEKLHHNFCIWLNRQLDRPDLAFCDLWAW